MAEGGYDPRVSRNSSVNNRPKFNQVCRYFLHGACNKGDSCLYNHDRSRAVPMDTICRYYQYGQCAYGEKCRYDHVKRQVSSKDESPSDVHSQPTQNGRALLLQDKDQRTSSMVTLKKGGIDEPSPKKITVRDEKKWVQARDFVPGQKYYGAVSYADAVQPYSLPQPAIDEPQFHCEPPLLCPYFAHGDCQFGVSCPYVHGDICDMCGMPRLHPTDQQQRSQHEKECLAQHEKDMELAFTIQASKDKECGICLDNILDKDTHGQDKRFGILENCNHCFCLDCIRQWRNNKSVTIETHRSCPTCRTHSDFVTPSKYWVECPEEKKKLIDAYKQALSSKPCNYFKEGKGECPFNSKCFYKHALADGSIVSGNLVQRRRRTNADGENLIEDDLSLWDFVERREHEGGYSLQDELSIVLNRILQYDSDEDDNNNNLLHLQYNFALTDSESDSDSDFV